MHNAREHLEKAIFEDFDDFAAHAAYGDLLSEEGDPRGELIQTQLALESESLSAEQRTELKANEQALLDKHRPAWLGPLAEYFHFEIEWARGHIDRLAVHGLSFEFAHVIARAPQLRFLRRLEIRSSALEARHPRKWTKGYDVTRGFGEELLPLAHGEYLQNVRSLQIGVEMNEANHFHSSNDPLGRRLLSSPFKQARNCINADGVHKVVAHLPRLEELHLYAGNVPTRELFQLTNVSKLRLLRLYHAHQCPLNVLASNPAFSSLAELLVCPSGIYTERWPGPHITGLLAFVNSAHFPELRHLQLNYLNLGDEGCTALLAAGILKRLKKLDLRQGTITDLGARTLTKCKGLKHLQLLDLAYNRLTESGIQALRNVLGDALKASPQSIPEVLIQPAPQPKDHHDDDDEDYYDGDWE